MTGRTETFLQNVTIVSDSSLVRIIEPLTTQATVPVNPEIGPVAPVATTTETATETEPPPGYNTGDPTLVPDHALISGPASQIRNVTEVATERIIMTGRTETFLQNVTVVSDSSLVRIIEPLTTQATVPVNPEIGPIAPVATTAETATQTETAPEKKPKSKGNQ